MGGGAKVLEKYVGWEMLLQPSLEITVWLLLVLISPTSVQSVPNTIHLGHGLQVSVLNGSSLLISLNSLGLKTWYSSPPLKVLLISAIAVTCYQLWSKDTKWKIPEISNSYFKLCAVLNTMIKISCCPALSCPEHESSLCSVPPLYIRVLTI